MTDFVNEPPGDSLVDTPLVDVRVIRPDDSETTQALETMREAQFFQIESAAAAGEGAEMLRSIVQRKKAINDKRLDMTRPLDDAKKRIMSFFDVPLRALSEAETMLRDRLFRFNELERRRQQEEQRKLDAEAERQRNLLAARADAAAAKGQTAKAHLLETRASALVAPTAAPPPKLAGVSTRENWDFEILDASLLPRAFLIPDEKKIRATVKAMKADAVDVLGGKDAVAVYDKGGVTVRS